MKNLLYILSKPSQNFKDYEFLIPQEPASNLCTFVLIEGGVYPQEMPADRVYVIEENETVDKNKISYRDMLSLIFSSDNSIVV